MSKVKQLKMVDELYQAVRKTYGYDTHADELVDFIGDMYDNSYGRE